MLTGISREPFCRVYFFISIELILPCEITLLKSTFLPANFLRLLTKFCWKFCPGSGCTGYSSHYHLLNIRQRTEFCLCLIY